MTTTYECITGDYLSAVAEFARIGGHFYPGRNPDAPSTIVSGHRCLTFWPPNSSLLPKCKAICHTFGFDWQGQTSGRIARQIIKEILNLEGMDGGFSNRYRAMARDGGHWHYTYVETGYHPYLLEFDLKSAYFTSLFHGASLNYHEFLGFRDDCNALENLKAIEPILPKFMRLIILGILASHKMHFYVRDKSSEDSFNMLLKTRYEIKYGGAFNAAHKAIRRTYEAMKKIHSIGGSHIKRIHTDSFALTHDCPTEVEYEIFNFLERNKYPVSIKAQGSAHFLNLNEGIIGNQLKGAKELVLSEFREKEIKIPKHELDSNEFHRWIERKLKVENELELIENSRKEKLKEFEQSGIDFYKIPA